MRKCMFLKILFFVFTIYFSFCGKSKGEMEPDIRIDLDLDTYGSNLIHVISESVHTADTNLHVVVNANEDQMAALPEVLLKTENLSLHDFSGLIRSLIGWDVSASGTVVSISAPIITKYVLVPPFHEVSTGVSQLYPWAVISLPQMSGDETDHSLTNLCERFHNYMLIQGKLTPVGVDNNEQLFIDIKSKEGSSGSSISNCLLRYDWKREVLVCTSNPTNVNLNSADALFRVLRESDKSLQHVSSEKLCQAAFQEFTGVVPFSIYYDKMLDVLLVATTAVEMDTLCSTFPFKPAKTVTECTHLKADVK